MVHVVQSCDSDFAITTQSFDDNFSKVFDCLRFGNLIHFVLIIATLSHSSLLRDSSLSKEEWELRVNERFQCNFRGGLELRADEHLVMCQNRERETKSSYRL